MGLYNIIILQLNSSACWVLALSSSSLCWFSVRQLPRVGRRKSCSGCWRLCTCLISFTVASLHPSLPPGLKREEGLQDFSSSPWDDFTGTCQVCLLLCSLQPMKSSERARPDEGVTRSSAGGSCLAMTAKQRNRLIQLEKVFLLDSHQQVTSQSCG